MIRLANLNDLSRLVDIYYQSVEKGGITADWATPDVPVAYLNNLSTHVNNPQYPLYVIEDEAKNIIGYSYLAPTRQRAGWKNTVEITYYFDLNHVGRGLGSKMLAFIIDEATRLGYRSLLATIHAKNEASAALLKKFKFDQWGFYPEVVYNAHLDQWFDIGIFGRKLN